MLTASLCLSIPEDSDLRNIQATLLGKKPLKQLTQYPSPNVSLEGNFRQYTVHLEDKTLSLLSSQDQGKCIYVSSLHEAPFSSPQNWLNCIQGVPEMTQIMYIDSPGFPHSAQILDFLIEPIKSRKFPYKISWNYGLKRTLRFENKSYLGCHQRLANPLLGNCWQHEEWFQFSSSWEASTLSPGRPAKCQGNFQTLSSLSFFWF